MAFTVSGIKGSNWGSMVYKIESARQILFTAIPHILVSWNVVKRENISGIFSSLSVANGKGLTNKGD